MSSDEASEDNRPEPEVFGGDSAGTGSDSYKAACKERAFAFNQHKERVKARTKRRLGSLAVSLPPAGSAPSHKVAQNASERAAKDKRARAQLIADKRQLDKVNKKSRSAKGRGLPKKGGAGGKGTWGKPGSDDMLEEDVDSKDPNYDSENDDKTALGVVEIDLTPEEAESIIKDIIVQYFQHSDTDDVADSACDLKITGDCLYLFAKVAVNVSLDARCDNDRELVSVLLSDLYGYSVLLSEDIERAFLEILYDLDDITVDCPEAPMMLAKFIARAVADDCLAPKFITSGVENKRLEASAQRSLTEALGLTRMSHGLVALDSVWTTGDSRRPVKHLVRKFKAMLKEFHESVDTANFVKTLEEMGVPHFLHEVVYELIVKCLEENSAFSSPAAGAGDKACGIETKSNVAIEQFLSLLKHLTDTAIVSITQFENGVKRVYEDLAELEIDVPRAFISMESLAARFEVEMEILSPQLRAQLKSQVSGMFADQQGRSSLS